MCTCIRCIVCGGVCVCMCVVCLCMCVCVCVCVCGVCVCVCLCAVCMFMHMMYLCVLSAVCGCTRTHIVDREGKRAEHIHTYIHYLLLSCSPVTQLATCLGSCMIHCVPFLSLYRTVGQTSFEQSAFTTSTGRVCGGGSSAWRRRGTE